MSIFGFIPGITDLKNSAALVIRILFVLIRAFPSVLLLLIQIIFLIFYFSKIPSVIFFQPITQRDHLKARGHVLNICLLNSDVETR